MLGFHLNQSFLLVWLVIFLNITPISKPKLLWESLDLCCGDCYLCVFNLLTLVSVIFCGI
ncbi:hypothetical protein H5410_040280 [Solanum commersonii]|uniref:Uncharacterized protein n=1 Tax=Solanum commersonii TaxID=4109 RepID=A0A9J5XS16_SOLCO|nr:hypothetical protein H5410_040280 [Solanum commersonii]